MSLETIVIQGLCGLSSAMIIFLVAVGLTIIFGILKVLNLAHASIFMIGAYILYWLLTTGIAGLPGAFWWVLLLAPLGAGAFGIIMEVLVIRPIYDRHLMYQYILTFGVILIIADMCKLLWGREAYFIGLPAPFQGSVSILGGQILEYSLFVTIVGVLIFVGLYFLLRSTKLGALIRAVTYNREMASALGKNVPMIYTGVFALGCWLAGFGGALGAPLTAVALGMDMAVLIPCFIVLVVGGMGSLTGAFIASIILGLVNSFGVLIIPQWALAFGYAVMAIVLIVRPHGLMGEPFG